MSFCTCRKYVRMFLTIGLLNWLLIIPPQAERAGVPLVGPDTSAPLSQWQAMREPGKTESGAFPTKADCENYRSKMIDDAKLRLLADAPQNVETLPSDTGRAKWTFGLGAVNAKCIASSDPRLRSN